MNYILSNAYKEGKESGYELALWEVIKELDDYIAQLSNILNDENSNKIVTLGLKEDLRGGIRALILAKENFEKWIIKK